MESNTNNISSAGLHRLDQRQRRSGTSEEVDVRQGQNALGSLLLSTALTPSHSNRLTDDTSVFLSRGVRNRYVPRDKSAECFYNTKHRTVSAAEALLLRV